MRKTITIHLNNGHSMVIRGVTKVEIGSEHITVSTSDDRWKTYVFRRDAVCNVEENQDA